MSEFGRGDRVRDVHWADAFGDVTSVHPNGTLCVDWDDGRQWPEVAPDELVLVMPGTGVI